MPAYTMTRRLVTSWRAAGTYLSELAEEFRTGTGPLAGPETWTWPVWMLLSSFCPPAAAGTVQAISGFKMPMQLVIKREVGLLSVQQRTAPQSETFDLLQISCVLGQLQALGACCVLASSLPLLYSCDTAQLAPQLCERSLVPGVSHATALAELWSCIADANSLYAQHVTVLDHTVRRSPCCLLARSR